MPIPTKYQTRLKCLRDSGLADKKPEVFGGIRWGSVGFSQVVVRFHFVQNSSQNKTWRQDKHTWSKPPTKKKDHLIQGKRNKITKFRWSSSAQLSKSSHFGRSRLPAPHLCRAVRELGEFKSQQSCDEVSTANTCAIWKHQRTEQKPNINDKNENIQNLWRTCPFQHHVVSFSSTWHFLWHTVPIISAVGLQ